MDFEKEENPFLGFRAVRYCLAHQDMYKVQLRAIVRASAYGKAKIMVPLVTTVEEVRTVKKLVAEIKDELRAEGIAFDEDIEVGCMMETAASAAIADLLAKEADFFSIGTNDLTGYTMAVDRGNAKVAYLYSTFQPAVLRSIRTIIRAGKEAGIPVGMCGEAAADPLVIPLLMSFGLDEYSVTLYSYSEHAASFRSGPRQRLMSLLRKSWQWLLKKRSRQSSKHRQKRYNTHNCKRCSPLWRASFFRGAQKERNTDPLLSCCVRS
jgi:phosphoenolpyruvate-protein kinase (PTS system EI component)